MEMSFAALIAAIGGGVLTLAMFVHLFFATIGPQFRARSSNTHVLEVSYKGRVISINLNQLDTEDPAKIDQMIQALRDSRNEPARDSRLEHA